MYIRSQDTSEGDAWHSRICCSRSHQLWGCRSGHWHVEHWCHLLHPVSSNTASHLSACCPFWWIMPLHLIWFWFGPLVGWAVNLHSREKVMQRLWLSWQQRSGSLMRRALKRSQTWQRISLALCSAKMSGALLSFTSLTHIIQMRPHRFITVRWTLLTGVGCHVKMPWLMPGWHIRV